MLHKNYHYFTNLFVLIMNNKNRNSNSINIFFAYARKDERFRKDLVKHLNVLERKEDVNFWFDQKIIAGQIWENEIMNKLEQADIILLLVSIDFLSSDYCYKKEMEKALVRHERGEVKVVPIILRPCNWKETPLSKIQVLPENGMPINSNHWENEDKVFQSIASVITQIVLDTLENKDTNLSLKNKELSQLKIQITKIEDALNKNKENYQVYIDGFFDAFISSLEYYSLEKRDTAFWESQSYSIEDFYLDEIKQMIELRDIFIDFLTMVIKKSNQINTEKLHSFFQELLQYQFDYINNITKHVRVHQLKGNHILFFTKELFLYTLAIALKAEKFTIIYELLNSSFFIKDVRHQGLQHITYVNLNYNTPLFGYVNQIKKMNYLDYEAEIVKERATHQSINYSELQEIDTILYYISCFQKLEENKKTDYWYPFLSNFYVGKSNYFNLQKLVSKKYFNKFKLILNVDDKDELIKKVELLKNKQKQKNKYNYNVPKISEGLNIKDIGSCD